MYISYDDYIEWYEPMERTLFKRLEMESRQLIDRHTTGMDNLRKLQRFFPTDEYDAAAVKFCAAKIINALYQILQAENTAEASRGYESTEHGLRGKIISSISAGNESISYATGGSASATAIEEATKDMTTRRKMLSQIVMDGLRGVRDANGVNLLYMGEYPRRYLC